MCNTLSVQDAASIYLFALGEVLDVAIKTIDSTSSQELGMYAFMEV